MSDYNLRENLASYAHDAWGGWMAYLFSKSEYNVVSGCYIIPKLAVDRWSRQYGTPYDQLSEKEKESDRNEADKIISIINEEKNMGNKTLHNNDISSAKEDIDDLIVFGDGDTFKLICKASSYNERWMKSTKAMEIEDIGCVVQVTTQQGDNVAEALTFVPGVKIELIDGDEKKGRKLVSLSGFRFLPEKNEE